MNVLLDAPIAALLVEDDARLAHFTEAYLKKHGVEVTLASHGDDALDEAGRTPFDVVVLDVMLPGKDGIAVCRGIREQSDVPIIMLTARTDESDRILGLESGADDYLAKPFSPRELLARMRALVRRDRGQLSPKNHVVAVGPLTLRSASRSAFLGSDALHLTSAEFDLLLALALRPGRALSREQLLRVAHGTESDAFDRAIDVQISRLRHKLGAHPGGADLIRTIRGAGYMLSAEGTGC